MGEMKAGLRQMFLDTLRELDVSHRMRARVKASRTVLEMGSDLYALDQFDTVRVVAIGKAAAEMAASLDELAGAGRVSGMVAASARPRTVLPNFEYFVGGHPYPNRESLRSAEAALKTLQSAAGERTLVVFLLSGGGSALLEKPLYDDISIEDAADFNRVLVTCGANIYEMNVLRKHFSAVKGGRLGLAAWPSAQVTLYVSDVPPDKPSTIASGPTMPDESTAADCVEVATRYGLASRLPAGYRRRLETGDIEETPKPGDGRFGKSRYVSVLSNEDGIAALERVACERGRVTVVDTSCDDWPLERAADHLLQRLRDLRRTAGGPACVISGGEVSSPVRGSGRGGRNLAFALYCAMQIEGEDITVLSAGTDGVDGNSPAAGAIADGRTVARGRALGVDARASFENSDSYTFFAVLGDEIVTGPTGNNVRDLRTLFAE